MAEEDLPVCVPLLFWAQELHLLWSERMDSHVSGACTKPGVPVAPGLCLTRRRSHTKHSPSLKKFEMIRREAGHSRNKVNGRELRVERDGGAGARPHMALGANSWKAEYGVRG